MKTAKQIAKQADQIKTRIDILTAMKTGPVRATFRTSDDSVNAELRLSAAWSIWLSVDSINYPKNLQGAYSDAPNFPLWRQMSNLSRQIIEAATLLPDGSKSLRAPISVYTKTGPARRSEARDAFVVETGRAFLADYRKATAAGHLAKVRKTITTLQAEQKALLPQLRAANSAYLAGKKTEREELKIRNAEALKSGRFWEADKETLKGYFHPPFDKNYLADVSEKWRAALFLECESVSYRWGLNREWGHKLAGTGRGYLCGIDDNGDEWGHRCNVYLSHDEHGNAGFDADVEDAMGDLFDIPVKNLPECSRQGDLLFCPATIPAYTEAHDAWGPITDNQGRDKRTSITLHPAASWEPRESHILTSPDLSHNGVYFRSASEITVSHTSHAAVTLPPGDYRLYMLAIEDAD